MKEDGSICSDIFDDVHPAFPIFDKSGNGIIFHGFHLPIDKLGLIYCFNRPTKLYYLKQYENNEEVKEEKSDSSKIIFEAETLTPDYYFAAFPKFTDDYKYLSFFCSKDKFHTHATSLGLDVIENLCEAENKYEIHTVIKRDYELNDIFSGLFGYHEKYNTKFIEGTHIMLISTVNKGKEIVVSANVETKSYKILEDPYNPNNWIDILSVQDEVAFIVSSSTSNPPWVYVIADIESEEWKWYKLAQVNSQHKSSEF